jgi:hypothetical protein
MVGYSQRQNSDLRPDFLDRFRYRLHFLALACFGVLLIAMTRLHFAMNVSVCFALYGALHASALVIALRDHHSIGRNCIFIAAAAGLSAMTLHVGIATAHWLGPRGGNVALYTALGLSAVTGAATYGVLIRACGIYELTVRALAVICLSCMLAAYAAMVTLAHFRFLGQWWLAVLWWYAFSGCLWYLDNYGLFGDRTCSGRTPRPRI